MKKLLVTESMRSGTTFLANLLNSQEGALVYPSIPKASFLCIIYNPDPQRAGRQPLRRLV